MIGLLEVTVLAGTLLGGIVWGVVVLVALRRGAPITGSARERAFLGRAWLFAPAWVPGLLLLAAFLPGLLGFVGADADHCLIHDSHHHHLCLLHPPHASEHVLGWLLPLVLLSPPIALLIRCVGRARGEMRWARALVSLSRGSDLGPDVRILDRDEAIALTVGLRRPTILLSTGLLRRVSDATLAVVLAHERAHVARMDTRYAFLERLFASIYPRSVGTALLVRIAAAREESCDAAAARVSGGSVVVARALLEVARLGVRPSLVGVSLASASLEGRVTRLLDGDHPRTAWWAALAVLVVALAAAGAGPVHTATERLITFLLH